MKFVEAHKQCSLWNGVLANPVNFEEFSFIHRWWEISAMSKLFFPDEVWAGLGRDKSVLAAPISVPKLKNLEIDFNNLT